MNTCKAMTLFACMGIIGRGPAQASDRFFSKLKIDVDVQWNPEHVEPIAIMGCSTANALAVRHWTCYEGNGGFAWDTSPEPNDPRVYCDPFPGGMVSGYEADAFVGDPPSTWGYTWHQAYAYTSQPHDSSPEAGIELIADSYYVTETIPPYSPCPYPDWATRVWGRWSSNASAIGVIDFQNVALPTGSPAWTATALGRFEFFDDTWGPEQIVRHAALLEERESSQATGAVLMVVNDQVWGAPEYVFESETGDWVAQLELEGPVGVSNFRVWAMTYTDASMDVDGSGRFNALDVAALQMLESSTDPNVVARWDFNRSGMLDPNDTGRMQSLVDIGADSGLFGDYNRNGVVSCADLSGASLFGYYLGGTGYFVEYDEDLDGYTSIAERHWLHHAVNPGDIDADRDVDIDDYLIVSAQYDKCEFDTGFNPYADINRDGCVDIDDVLVVLGNLDEGCP